MILTLIITIIGKNISFDLCSVTFDDRRYMSFLSHNYGITSYADLATENMRYVIPVFFFLMYIIYHCFLFFQLTELLRLIHIAYRWMGDARTIIGLLQQIFKGETYKMEAAVQIVEANKDKIKSNFPSDKQIVDNGKGPIQDTIPPLNEPVPNDWTIIKDDVSFFLTSKTPLLARGMLSHPCAEPNDGLLDLLLVRGNHGLFSKLDLFGKVETGHQIDSDAVSSSFFYNFPTDTHRIIDKI